MSQTLVSCLRDLATTRPEHVALRDKDRGVWREIPWKGYWFRVQVVARVLADLGIEAGDHVSILSENRPEWLYADLGIQALAAKSVGIYQTNPPADVAYILSHSGSKVLFCEDQEQVDKAIEIAGETPTVTKIVVFDPRGTRHYSDPRLMRWDELLRRGEELLRDEPNWVASRVDGLDPHEPSMVIYTSGTTGPPKGALISANNALSAAHVLNPLLGLSEQDSVLSYLPLCHVAEKIFTLFLPLSTGGTVHFGESIATIQQDLREVSPTVFLGVPRIWEKMNASVTLRMKDSSWLKRSLFDFFSARGRKIADPDRKTSRSPLEHIVWFFGDILVFRPLQERLGLRNCRLPVSGAAPIGQELLRWFHGIGVPVQEGYGMTECAGVSHISPIGTTRLGSVGQALSSLECRLADDGEILIRGPSVFCGYLHNNEATRQTIDSDGWLHTGDVGREDAQGFLFITGRKKEIIITAGGKNLSPEKIENALKNSPYVKEAVAIGDTRKFVSALIQIDGDAVGDWASRNKIAYTDFEDLTAREPIQQLIDAEIRQSNELLARVEQVRAFRLFPKELHQDDGELTATQKVRRRAIHEIWAPLIEQMYGASP